MRYTFRLYIDSSDFFSQLPNLLQIYNMHIMYDDEVCSVIRNNPLSYALQNVATFKLSSREYLCNW